MALFFDMSVLSDFDFVCYYMRLTSRSDTGCRVVLYSNGLVVIPGIGDVIADTLSYVSAAFGGIIEVNSVVFLTGNIVEPAVFK